MHSFHPSINVWITNCVTHCTATIFLYSSCWASFFPVIFSEYKSSLYFVWDGERLELKNNLIRISRTRNEKDFKTTCGYSFCGLRLQSFGCRKRILFHQLRSRVLQLKSCILLPQGMAFVPRANFIAWLHAIKVAFCDLDSAYV